MTLIIPAPLPQATKSWLKDTITASLNAAVDDTTYLQGYNILRWFVKGWIAHVDPEIQHDLSLFAFSKDFEGTLIPANSAKGYGILQAAKNGLLVLALHEDTMPIMTDIDLCCEA